MRLIIQPNLSMKFNLCLSEDLKGAATELAGVSMIIAEGVATAVPEWISVDNQSSEIHRLMQNNQPSL